MAKPLKPVIKRGGKTIPNRNMILFISNEMEINNLFMVYIRFYISNGIYIVFVAALFKVFKGCGTRDGGREIGMGRSQ